MSGEDLKKQHLRTQGKYSDRDLIKNRDKKHKISPSAKELNEKKVPKRYSNESKRSNNFSSDEYSPVKYEENSNYSFSEYQETKKPVVISSRGKHILSTTDSGESRIFYEPDFFCKDEAWHIYEQLQNTTSWNSKNIVIRGIEYPQPRLVAWYGPYPYSYSGTTLDSAEMPDLVVSIKERIEKHLKEQDIDVKFNSVLLNLYRDEKDSVAWHSDDELTLGICPTIASVSLGEVRKFEIRPKRMPEESQRTMFMKHGSLIIMDGCMQEDWEHRVPKEYHSKEARINLTFRTVFPIDKSQLPVKECNKQYADVSNSNKTTNSGRTIELDDENFPALTSNVKRSSSDMKDNGNVSGTSEVWDSDISLDDKKKVQNWVLDNNITCASKAREKIANGDKSSGENCIDSTALMLPDKITGREFKNSKEDLRFPMDEPKKKFSDRHPQKVQVTDNPSSDQSDERLQGGHIDDNQSGWGHDENRSYGRFPKTQNYDRKHWRKFDDERTFQNSNNDDDSRKKQSSGKYELRRDENYEAPRRQWRKDQNDRFAPTQANNRRQERYPRVQNDDERQGKNVRMRDDNRYDRIPPRRDGNRKNERRDPLPPRYRSNKGNPSRLVSDENPSEDCFDSDPLPPRYSSNKENTSRFVSDENSSEGCFDNDPLPPGYRSNKGNPSRLVSDENPPEDFFDNDKHASELVKKEHCTSNVGKEPSKNTLNAEAKEFVPIFLKPVNHYDQMNLEDLVHYQVKIMSGDILQQYTDSLKHKVEENFERFDEKEKEELQFLCAITDGTQTNKNQRLISEKMVKTVIHYLDRIRYS